MEYSAAYKLQKEIHEQRVQDRIPDRLLLLEHPPTLTVGKAGRPENILVSNESLALEGIALYFTDRGGDVTYHGPGQIVGYPIMDLRKRGGDLKHYIYQLEEVLILTLEDFAIHSSRDSQCVGVWIGRNKVGAIGLSVRQSVTMHGFALNVNPRMEHFALIRPCGLKDRKATSMHENLGFSPSIEEVLKRLIYHFSAVLGFPSATGP